MNIFTSKHRIFFGITLLVGVVFSSNLLHTDAFAQAANATAANGLQISPALVELNGDPGKSYTVDLSVLNVTGSTLSFTSSVNDFAAKDETGTPSILLDGGTPLATSIIKWVSPIYGFSLTPHTTQKIQATITIPSGAEPGGHYGVIRFTGTSPQVSGTGVGLSASAGTLILIRVSGNAVEKLNLITYEATENGNPNSIFESSDNLTFLTRFQNVGNVHLQPTGQIELRDGFGNKVTTLSVNSVKGYILPDSIRKFEMPLGNYHLFGHYTADISIAYGTKGEAIVESISFWILPYKLILAGLIVLITLIFIFRTLIKRYNSYIIQKANKQKQQNAKKTHKKQ